MVGHALLRDLLMDRLNYSAEEANTLADELETLAPVLLPLVERWVAGEDVHDTKDYQGYSLDSLQRERKMNVVAALLTLDWIIKDPAQALPLIRRGVF